ISRADALNKDWIAGRTGYLFGRRIIAFWNISRQADLVKDYVQNQVDRGNIDPHNDWISFKAAGGLMRAKDFIEHFSPEKVTSSSRDFTPEELAQAHVNPLLKASIIGAQAKSKKTAVQREAEESGFVHPGQKWWAPMSEQMHGAPMQLDSERKPAEPAKPAEGQRMRSPSKVGIVVRGVYYPPGKFAPGLIQASAGTGTSKSSGFISKLMEYAKRKHKGKPVAITGDTT